MSIFSQEDFVKNRKYGAAKKPSQSIVIVVDNFTLEKECERAMVDCAKAIQVTLFEDELANGTVQVIHDYKKTANTNNITVKVPAGWYLNGTLNGTLTLNTAGAKVECVPNGKNKEWWVG